MKRNIVLLFALLMFGFTSAQKNKFGDILNTRKLGYIYKDVKDKDKEDYYQQYYWMKKAEHLATYDHLKGIKPKIFYEFMKEVNPQIPEKKLEEDEIKVREEAELSLDQYFKNREFDNNQVLNYNLNSYVDPYDRKYDVKVEAEKIKTLVEKRLYSFSAFNREDKTQESKYLWIDKDKDKYEIVSIIPDEKDKDFYNDLKVFMPGYSFPDFVPTVEMGDKRSGKQDRDYFYITPFQMGSNNIVYRTKDFKDFELVKIKKNGAPWDDIDIKKD